MKKPTAIILTFMLLSLQCAQSNENTDTNNDTTSSKLEQVVHTEYSEDLVEVVSERQKKDSVEITIGSTRLIIHKKDDYNYRLVAYKNSKEIADTTAYTGFAPSYVYSDENFFVMDVDVNNNGFVVYDAEKNTFRKYEGYYASTMSIRVVDNKLYAGYYSFDEQMGSLLIIDLNTAERKHVFEIEGETMTSSEIMATKQDGKVYILMDCSSDQKVYAIENNDLIKVNTAVTDSFENKKLEELFK